MLSGRSQGVVAMVECHCRLLSCVSELRKGGRDLQLLITGGPVLLAYAWRRRWG